MAFYKKSELILVSACLLGINCRYDGKNKFSRKVYQLRKKAILIPVCPEQLAGLSTPRDPVEKKGRRLINQSGQDFTKIYQKGAKEVLKIVKLLKIKKAILKEKSPSCGVNWIYDGSFSKKLIKGQGVLTSLLKKNQVKVKSEEEI